MKPETIINPTATRSDQFGRTDMSARPVHWLEAYRSTASMTTGSPVESMTWINFPEWPIWAYDQEMAVPLTLHEDQGRAIRRVAAPGELDAGHGEAEGTGRIPEFGERMPAG